MKLSDEVMSVSAGSAITLRLLKLPEHLDREVYLRVNKALVAARGNWFRKAEGHVCPFDLRELIGEVVETASVVDAKQALQFFGTPGALTRCTVEIANVRSGDRALKPSAGIDRIACRILMADASEDAVEIDDTNCKMMRHLGHADGLAAHRGRTARGGRPSEFYRQPPAGPMSR
jgi:hypothetical protein